MKHQDNGASADQTQTDRLLTLIRTHADLWHSSDGRTFATVMAGKVKRSFVIESRDFEYWLREAYFTRHGSAPSSTALNDTVAQSDAKARFLGNEHEVFIRTGQMGGHLFLDLADDLGRVVEITPDGWHTLINPEVRFLRTPGMLPLPLPVEGGSVRELRGFLNVLDENSFILAVSYEVASLRPTGPYPIVFLQGEQGSAKSTTARVLRRLIDPANPVDKTKPRSEQDLFIDADSNWILVFDNLSTIPDWLADAFCRIATGGGFATRKLYTGRDQETFSACRPQILNGIEDLAVRDDLRDRGLLFVLPVISDEHRIPEERFWRDFDQAHPRILGALLDAACAALRNVDSIRLPRKPRMADFAVWVAASEEALPWEEGTFLSSYERNRAEALHITLEHDVLSTRLEELLEEEGDWAGTATQLFAKTCLGRTGDWSTPKSASEMSKRLKRISAALRGIGIEVTWDRSNDHIRTRIITVRRVHGVRSDDDPR